GSQQPLFQKCFRKFNFGVFNQGVFDLFFRINFGFFVIVALKDFLGFVEEFFFRRYLLWTKHLVKKLLIQLGIFSSVDILNGKSKFTGNIGGFLFGKVEYVSEIFFNRSFGIKGNLITFLQTNKLLYGIFAYLG